MIDHIFLNISSKAGITIIDGDSDCGKTMTALSLIAPELQKGVPGYYFSYGREAGETEKYLEQMGSAFSHFKKGSIENILQIDVSELTSSYVIIDELDVLVNRKPFAIKEETHRLLRNLLKRDCRVILVCRCWSEVDLWLDPLVNLMLMGPRKINQWDSLGGDIAHWIRNNGRLATREFLVVDRLKVVNKVVIEILDIEKFAKVSLKQLGECLGELLLVVSDVAQCIRMKSPYCPDIDPKKCLGDIFYLANLLCVLSELSHAIQTNNTDIIRTKALFIANYWESNKDLYDYSSDGLCNIQRGITVMLQIARNHSKECANKLEVA